MKKSYLMMAAAAALFAACSSNDLAEEKAPQTTQPTVEEQAVTFDAYTSRGTTRAGYEGTLNTELLKGSANGFGVFGYYTNNEGYSETAVPDFMYNQQVKFEGGTWSYSPVKYWPNEFGTEAVSERIDYLTFFAYAPYVTAEPKTGKVAETSDETGIIGLTRNTTIGDPLVKYAVNFNPTKCVDLCWGVADANFTETVSSVPTNDIKAKTPYINVIKPQTDSRIKFDFKHALAQLNVQIDTDVDVMSHADGELDSYTRIFVRSVTFEGFTDKGSLNLNSSFAENPTPTWYNINGDGNLSTTPVTIHDLRYDGREGVTNVDAPSEGHGGLNPAIIQSGAYTVSGTPEVLTSTTTGVTHTEANLFAGADKNTPILIIPNKQNLRVKIVYDVETYDPNLSTFLSDGKTHGSTIENAITKDILLSSREPMVLEAGKKFIVHLHLGLTSVKFDASVADWTAYANEGSADLPVNSPVSVGAASADVPYTFPGGVGAHSVTSSPTGVTGKTGTDTSGEVTVAANTTVDNIQYTVTITDADATPKTITFSIKQSAAALGLSLDKTDMSTITVKSTATGTTWGSKVKSIKVEKQALGAGEFVEIPNETGAAGFQFAEATSTGATVGTITLGTPAASTDVIRVTITAGDAAEGVDTETM